jgi:hypothetical protein
VGPTTRPAVEPTFTPRPRRLPRLRAPHSVRPLSYSYEHMFQGSKNRLRALMTLLDDVLGDPEAPAAPHPHRRPVRIERTRRGGSVAARPAHCLSPVRPQPDRSSRDRVS